MNSLTIAYISTRGPDSKFEWFYDLLVSQYRANFDSAGHDIKAELMLVDEYWERDLEGLKERCPHIAWIRPKHSLWSGEYQLPKERWWNKGNSINSALASCRTEWFCCVDDRCVLMPGWLGYLKEAMAKGYGVFGAYEKRANMKVENGVIVEPGEVTGKDSREEYVNRYWGGMDVSKCGGEWGFGCTMAAPLEWWLQINGVPEDMCDSSGGEDTATGLLLQNNGFDIRYDKRMKMIEDRTPGQLGKTIHRKDKGTSPNDKSHSVLNRFLTAKTSGNSFDLRKLREDRLSGKPWPPPTASDKDWFDGQPVKEFEA